MGEVYRAEDTMLGREVAIKVLPEAVAVAWARSLPSSVRRWNPGASGQLGVQFDVLIS